MFLEIIISFQNIFSLFKKVRITLYISGRNDREYWLFSLLRITTEFKPWKQLVRCSLHFTSPFFKFNVLLFQLCSNVNCCRNFCPYIYVHQLGLIPCVIDCPTLHKPTLQKLSHEILAASMFSRCTFASNLPIKTYVYFLHAMLLQHFCLCLKRHLGELKYCLTLLCEFQRECKINYSVLFKEMLSMVTNKNIWEIQD